MSLRKILIVDDEIIIARELEARLKSMGYEVCGIASSGAEAIRLADEMQPSLVLMDIVLKGEMDGIEAAAEIRRRFHIPIIYVTAYTDRKTLERARVTEPFGYIVKPFSERELEANIEMALYRHRVESRLRRMERWFADAVHDIGDAVITTNLNGIVMTINPAAEAITEWSSEDALGGHLSEVLRLVDRSTGTPISFEEAIEGPVICLADTTLLIDRFERRVPVDSTTSCIRNRDNQPTGTITVFRDVTGRRHGAMAAMNADVALATTQVATLNGMLQLCTESMVRNLQVALARIWILNTTGETLLLQASTGITPPADGIYSKIPIGMHKVGMIARERQPYLTNNLNNEPVNDQEWLEREGIVAFVGYPMMVEDRLVGVMAMLSRHPFPDNVLETMGTIASSIAVGVERKRLEDQLRHAQKMEVIGQLAGGVAHDFNNLLTIISGYSQLLLTDSRLDEDTQGLVGQIALAGDRATALTRQLLAFSRKQVMKASVLDLNTLVTDIEKMLRRLIDESITLAVVLDPELARITADPGQLEQVLMNLAVNSRDAMPDGGKLTIETRNVDLDETFALTHLTATAGGYVMLAVSDTGCGMTPEVMAHIFEPFFTTKGAGKGTGLGLATVYGIIRQSGGYISVYSEPDIGTTFKIYFPRTEEQRPARRSHTSNLPLPKGSETILLVEDEEAVRALSHYILQQCGYKVLQAGTGEEALRLCEQYEEPIHIIVTDVVLPAMGGRHLAERLAVLRPGINVLYMSGYTDDAVIRHGVLQAETAFLQKPFTPSALARKVRDVLDNPQTTPGRSA